MNKRNILILFIAVVFTALASCTPDDGLDLDSRDKYVGSWTCFDSSAQGNFTYSSIISRKGDFDTVTISNFYYAGSDKSVYAIVDGNSIDIPNQLYDGSYFVSGSGTFSNDKIKINYIARDGTVDDNGVAVYQ